MVDFNKFFDRHEAENKGSADVLHYTVENAYFQHCTFWSWSTLP